MAITVHGTNGITFPDNIVQDSAAVWPTFNTGTYTDLSFATWYQATGNWFVTVSFGGPYTNDFYVYAGPSTSTYYTIARYGDDINSNTKWGSFSFFIRKNYWFYATSEVNYGFRRWTLS